MRSTENWKDYELIDASEGERLERWGDIILIRPDPQAILRITIRSGHPRKIREPIIITIPRIKRIIGEDPAVERYSFVATEIINAPITRPMISGLAYCTTSAW